MTPLELEILQVINQIPAAVEKAFTAFIERHPGHGNQKTHGNRFGAGQAKESLRRLKDDKGAREKYKEAHRKRQGSAEPHTMTMAEFKKTVNTRDDSIRAETSFDDWLKGKGHDPTRVQADRQAVLEAALGRVGGLGTGLNQALKRGNAANKLVDEYQRDIKEGRIKSNRVKRELTGHQADQAYIATKHKQSIRQAIVQGKPIPERVLSEYPDLKRIYESRRRKAL